MASLDAVINVNFKTKTDQYQQKPPYSDLEHYSLSALQTPTTTPQVNHNLDQVAPGAHSLQDFSFLGAKRSSQLLPQTLSKKILKGTLTDKQP